MISIKLCMFSLVMQFLILSPNASAKKVSSITHKHNNRTHSHPLPRQGIEHTHDKKQSNKNKAKLWAAVAVDNVGNWGAVVKQSSKKLAETKSLSICKNSNNHKFECRILVITDKLVYLAIGASVWRLYAEIGNNKESTRQRAYNLCVENTYRTYPCKIVFEGANGYERNP